MVYYLAGLQATVQQSEVIVVCDGNFENRGELLLEHRHDGVDLRQDYARDALENIFRLWSRPVHLRTIVEGKEKLLGYDGESHLERTTTDE